MRAGVLIAGSLIWDEHPLRARWRATRLSVEDKRRVQAPLRYGRLSTSRSDTYTMVFSAECVEDGLGTGVGLAVPFKRAPESVADLACEATELWRVERKSESEGRGVMSASWGSVGLLVRPDSQNEEDIRAAWADLVKQSPKYGTLTSATGEPLAVERASGLAAFAWSALGPDVGDLDVLIFTATKATITNGEYPSLAAIAQAWRAAPLEARYFKRNRDWGITTQQDSKLQDLLGDVLDPC